MDERRTALIFKAFCDENRIRILKMLKSGEKCACKMLEALDVTQPTLSHHMKILCDSGIVVGRKEGKWMHYSLSAEGAKTAAELLKELGVNLVRTSHYLQSTHFLDRCDELGLLVFEEIPGWQHIGDEAWQDISVQNVEEMILRDYNHPSIILWGVRINESPDSSAFLPSPRISRETPSSGSAASCVQPSSCAEKSPYRQSGPCAAFGK